LLQFHPAGGPLEGGTKLTVSGVNLGKAAEDLVVTVAGSPCAVVDDSYVPSERFVLVMSSCWNIVLLSSC